MNYATLIVDDEPLAREVLESFVSKTPGLQLVASCANAIEANKVLQSEHIDIIFLDIQMPEITGIEFLKMIKSNAAVIITSAYPDYAVEGFDLDVVDYLLKPISFERFLKAFNKAILHVSKEETHAKPEEDYIFVKSDKKIIRIELGDIFYIEGLKDYVMIFTTEQRIITLQTMKNFEERLSAERFKRIHRSFIVAVDKIKAIVGNSVQVKDKLLPIGKLYREELMKMVEKHHLIK